MCIVRKETIKAYATQPENPHSQIWGITLYVYLKIKNAWHACARATAHVNFHLTGKDRYVYAWNIMEYFDLKRINSPNKYMIM